MLDEIPTLTTAERALLHRFRVDESPEPAIAARVLRNLSAELGAADVPTERPWWLWLRAGGLSVAVAAAALLVMGGTARVVARASAPAPTEAVDATPSEATHATHPSAAEISSPSVAPLPAVPAPAPVVPEPAIDLAVDPGAAIGAAPTKPSRATPRQATPAATTPAPIDSAAEIAMLKSIKVERDPATRLATIQRYRRDFARGEFLEEVAVLEIQTLCKLGRTADATERSNAFVRAFGDSAFSTIARRGCAEAKP